MAKSRAFSLTLLSRSFCFWGYHVVKKSCH